MLLNLLLSLCCVVCTDDTLNVATVSAQRNAAAISLSPIQSISGDRLEQHGTIGLHEALRQFAGISIKDYGGIGGLKSVSVRNMGASHTSVVYDGIAISDAQNGQIDISRFNVDDISSITMSIGMPDEIFCNARHLASAGILKIEGTVPSFTHGPTHINARMTVGSFNTYNPYISICHILGGKYTAKASLNGTFSKSNYPFISRNGQATVSEIRLNSDVKSYGAEVDFHADWGVRGQLKAKVNFHDSERGLPGPVILYTRNSYERLWDRMLISNIMYDCNLGEKWKLHADAGYTYDFNKHLDTDPAYQTPQDSRYIQQEYGLAVRTLYQPSDKWKIVIAEDLFINELSSNIPECPFPLRLTSVSAISTEYRTDRLKASASLAGTFMTEKLLYGTSPDERFRLSPIIGLSWNFHEGMHLRACYKEGFRMPTFNDLYYARVGNTGLKPETAHQFNTGLTFGRAFGKITADLTADAYCNLVKDKITAIPTMFIWKMRNIGKVIMYGTDLRLASRMHVCRWLTADISGSWSIQYASDITDPASKSYGHQIPYTPRHCGNGSLTLETPIANFSYRMSSVGKRYFQNQNIKANEIQGYTDHSISINRDILFGGKNIYKIHLSIEALNLSGNNYEIIHCYPMPGCSFRFSIKFRY